jgi:hypothetical protein
MKGFWSGILVRDFEVKKSFNTELKGIIVGQMSEKRDK